MTKRCVIFTIFWENFADENDPFIDNSIVMYETPLTHKSLWNQAAFCLLTRIYVTIWSIMNNLCGDIQI